MGRKLKTDIVVAGHICLDVTPGFPKSVAGQKIQDILKPGSLVLMDRATVSCGGPVSNTGLALRRFGQKVLLMGKCADDAFGHLLLERLRAEAPGAERGMAVVRDDATSYTVVITPPGLDRMFLHSPGANNTFTAADVNVELVRGARLFHFGYPPLMKRMYAGGGRELARLFRQAAETGVTTSLDLAIPDPSSAAGNADWAAILKRTLPHVDLFVPSGEEMLFMLNRKRFDALRRKAGTGEMLNHFTAEDVSRVGAACLEYGAAVVLIKCGKLGAYLRTADERRLKAIGRAAPRPFKSWVSRELWQSSYKVRKVVSATGSGDCAIAGFLSAYLNGEPAETAMRCCCAAGHQNVQVPDAVSGIRTWSDTLAMIDRKPALNRLDIPMRGWRYDNKRRQHLGPADGR